MDEILEFVLELILEGGIEVSANKKVTKWIRYPLIFGFVILFLTMILLIFWLSVSIYKASIPLSIAFLVLGIALLVGGINKFKNMYIEKNKDINDNHN